MKVLTGKMHKSVGMLVLLLATTSASGCAGKENEANGAPASTTVASQSAQAIDSSPPSAATDIGASSVKLANYNRAESSGRYGTLSIVPEEGETSGTVEASSCYGKEGESEFSGIYHVIYRNKDEGLVKDLGVIGNGSAESTVRTSETIGLNELQMGETDVYYFSPVVDQCHGSEYTFYGINRNRNAFPFRFDMGANSKHLERITLLPGTLPKLNDDGTIELDSYGEPGSMPPSRAKYVFKLDGDTFVLTKSTPLPD
ncbi:hypothetical protein [Cohnella soli]|uniref:Lipoprotein n=1 Tax=Cohnella soli TaxID=425005 RepID=A0ABW0I129_9BACL